jgi:hypothetical protein
MTRRHFPPDCETYGPAVTLRFLTVVAIRRYVSLILVDHPVAGSAHMLHALIVFPNRRKVAGPTGRPLFTAMNQPSTELL